MHSFLHKFPKIYAYLSYFKKKPNHEKILYLKTIKKGFEVIDAGANKGYYTTLFSSLVGSSGKVHAFEPVPENYDNLVRNIRNYPNNIITNKLALGETEAETTISYNLEELEKASLVNSSNQQSKTTETSIITIDKYVEKKGIQKVNFVKCDVEGFEKKVLIGMHGTLENLRPKLSIEVTLPQKEREEIVEILSEHGYDRFQVIEKGFPKWDPKKYLKSEYIYLYAYSSKPA